MASTDSLDDLKHAVVHVAAGGRGFVMDTGDPLIGRVVVTAAHCLPHPEQVRAACETDVPMGDEEGVSHPQSDRGF